MSQGHKGWLRCGIALAALMKMGAGTVLKGLAIRVRVGVRVRVRVTG